MKDQPQLWNLGIGSREFARRFLTGPHSLGVEGTEAGEFEHFILAQIILPLEQKKSFWEAIEGRAFKWAEGESVICGIFIVTKEYFNKLPNFDQTIREMCPGPLISLSKVEALLIELDKKLSSLGRMHCFETVSDLFTQGDCLLQPNAV